MDSYTQLKDFMSNKMFTIVVAGGSSARFGADKLFQILDTETVLDRSVRIASEFSDGVIVVIDPDKYCNENIFAVVKGGATRSESVRNGLNAVPKDVEIVAIHDAARPMVTKKLFEHGRKLIEQGRYGVIPGIAVTDTIKSVKRNSEVIETTHARVNIRAVQTPQIFNAQALRKAYENSSVETDDGALLEKAGYEVVIFDGEESNRKITTILDLNIVRNELSGSALSTTIRIGTGYDIHPFSKDKNKKLILGGIEIDHIGLEGHSDSDAVAHSITDSLLSAIGAPDLGTLFPANKKENKDADSFKFLDSAIQLVADQGYEINNISIIINAQEPKLSNYLEAMKEKISISIKSISNKNTQISITPKHGEGIGEIGRAEAIAVYSTILLNKIGIK